MVKVLERVGHGGAGGWGLLRYYGQDGLSCVLLWPSSSDVCASKESLPRSPRDGSRRVYVYIYIVLILLARVTSSLSADTQPTQRQTPHAAQSPPNAASISPQNSVVVSQKPSTPISLSHLRSDHLRSLRARASSRRVAVLPVGFASSAAGADDAVVGSADIALVGGCDDRRPARLGGAGAGVVVVVLDCVLQVQCISGCSGLGMR